MKKQGRKATESGVITVYLALILLLILSLICTIIESARISTAKVYAKRALSTAMDSVWAEYYGPLWEEYHIFGYDAGAGSRYEKAGRIGEKLTEYMSYTFDPNSGLDTDAYPAGMELYDIATFALSVTEQTRLMDYDGELLINEAVEYMKYHELGDSVTSFLEKASLLESPKKVSYVYAKKLSAEEELAKADRSILRLMELLDGIQTSKKGIKFDNNGQLIIKDYFAKKLCFGEVTMDSVGLNHRAVFDALKEHYVKPADEITRYSTKVEQLRTLEEQIASLKQELLAAETSLENKREQQQAISDASVTSGAESGSKAIKKEIKVEIKVEKKEEIKQIENHREDVQSQILELQERVQPLTEEAEAEINHLEHILKELAPITKEAAQEVESILENTANAASFIEGFEEGLNKYGDVMQEETMKGLEESLSQMKRYISYNDGNESYQSIYENLRANQTILSESQKLLQASREELEEKNYSNTVAYAEKVLLQLQGYHTKELSLDYSSLILTKTKQQNPIEEINKLLESGITGLVLDPDHVSDKKIEQAQLPSKEVTLQSNISEVASRITSFLNDILEGGDKQEMGSLLNDFSDLPNLTSGIKDGINMLTEQLLYQEYLKEHFICYPAMEKILQDRKPSVLDYEQEYLFVGDSSDKANLSAVISKIIFLRMMLNFATILGDKVRCEEARFAATAIVGFSGLPILISITQAALLLIWSLTESLVDTCALLKGKEVPVLKQKLILQFPEIFLINRSFLESKAATFTDTRQLSLSYEDYLHLFLWMKQRKTCAYRSMDLIQENLRLRYEESFDFRNCLFGFEAEAEYKADSRFLAIPVVSRAMGLTINGFSFESTSAYSY